MSPRLSNVQLGGIYRPDGADAVPKAVEAAALAGQAIIHLPLQGQPQRAGGKGTWRLRGGLLEMACGRRMCPAGWDVGACASPKGRTGRGGDMERIADRQGPGSGAPDSLGPWAKLMEPTRYPIPGDLNPQGT